MARRPTRRSCKVRAMLCGHGVSRRQEDDMRRRLVCALALILAGCIAIEAQTVVFDPAVTLRNTVTALAKEYLVNLQQQERRQLDRMSRRLSLFTDLAGYPLPSPRASGINTFIVPEPVRSPADNTGR